MRRRTKTFELSEGAIRRYHQRLVCWRADPTAPGIGAHLVNPRFLTGMAICGKRPSDVWMIAKSWDRQCEKCLKLSTAITTKLNFTSAAGNA